MTHISIAQSHLHPFDKVHPMIYAKILDHDHNLCFEVVEWIDASTHHVERENSYMIENYQPSIQYEMLTEIFDLLDHELDTIYQEQLNLQLVQGNPVINMFKRVWSHWNGQ